MVAMTARGRSVSAKSAFLDDARMIQHGDIHYSRPGYHQDSNWKKFFVDDRTKLTAKTMFLPRQYLHEENSDGY
jgi:hypothetical protein